MSTKKYIMPKTSEIGVVGDDRRVRMNEAMKGYLGGLEDVSGRVADYKNPATVTTQQLAQALIDAGLMKAS